MKGSTYANDVQRLLFNGTAIANIADNAASAPLTNLQVALHATWPGAAGSQTTGEVAYTGYARVAVARTSGGWTVTGNSVSPVAAITFGTCTAGSATANFFSVGTASSGTGKILHSGVIGGGPKIGVGFVTDTVSAPAHGLAVNDPVVLWATLGGTLPTGITEGTIYFVKTAPDADNITLSATAGGATLDLTAIGSAILQKVSPIVITSSPAVTPQLTTATAIIEY